MVWTIFAFLTTMIESFIYFWYMERISQRKHGTIVIVVAILCFAGGLSLIDYYQIMVSYKLLIMIVYGGLISWFVFDIGWQKLLIASLLYMLAILVSETSVMGIIMSVHGIQNFQVFLAENGFRMQAFFLSKVIDLFILHIAFHMLNPSKSVFKRRELLLLFMQALCFSLTILISMEVSLTAQSNQMVRPFFFSALSLFCLITYFISFRMIEWHYDMQKQEQETMQLDAYREKKMQYYQVKKEAQDDVRRIYHDLKNHLEIISRMEENQITGLCEYVGEITQCIEPYAKYHNSGNDVIDMLLLDKKQAAEEKGIRMEVQIEEDCIIDYNTFQMCTLFANAIDNAIEATEHCEKEKRLIRVKVCRIREGLSMLFQNPCEWYGNSVTNNFLLTKKYDKRRHGFGMGNMERAVKSLGGRMNVEVVNRVFELFVLIDNR